MAYENNAPPQMGVTPSFASDFSKHELELIKKRLEMQSIQLEIHDIKRTIADLENELKGNPANKELIKLRLDDLKMNIDSAEKDLSGKKAIAEHLQKEAGKTPGSLTTFQTPSFFNPATPFDATQGLRNSTYMPAPGAARSETEVGAIGTRAYVFDPNVLVTKEGKVESTGPGLQEIYHQPLIQVKVRVVEVVRGDSLQASSVLDYISHTGSEPSLITGGLNDGIQKTTAATRFPTVTEPLLVGGKTLAGLTGSGALVNLTAEHINLVAKFLASELNADVVTAPEGVTLNGQNVEFVAGSRLPFELGQNVVTGATATNQQFFYKHVGTYVSVTPKIVNWGFHGEGDAKAPISAAEIRSWKRLIRWMHKDGKILDAEAYESYQPYESYPVIPINVQSDLLQTLKRYSKADLITAWNESDKAALENDHYFRDFIYKPVAEPTCNDCTWRPDNCTIDLAVVVRLSEPGLTTITANRGSENPTTTIAVNEQNVRAVANIIQLKSGNGAVMAGLIGEREVQEVSKVPLLGDTPFVGALFRSKATSRLKTEVLIFIEAQVLDHRPEAVRAESARNFRLSHEYVSGEFLDHPLECASYRAGFGAYLPPACVGEQIFWERAGRKVRKAATEAHDIFKFK